MKLIVTYLILGAALASGQQFSVRVAGSNMNGTPYFWPISILEIGTNSAQPPRLTMSAAEVGVMIATNLAAYTANESNLLFAVASHKMENANYARLVELYTQIPTARSNFTTGRSLLVTIDASFASGTNNTAQLVSRIRQMVTVQSETIRYLDGIVEILQRLGPVLRDMYKPEQDDVQ